MREPWYPSELVAIEPAADRASVDVSLVDDCTGNKLVVSYRIAALKARVKNAAALDLHRAKRYAEAEKGFRRVVALDPDFDLGYTNLASALARQGQTTEAVDALRPLLARNPAWVLLPGMIAYGWTRPGREACEGTDPGGVAIIRSPRLP